MTAALAPDAVTAAPGCAAAAVAFRFQGHLRVTVVAKATFAFAAGVPLPRVDPQPILRAELNHGRRPTASVRFTSDLAPLLPQAEVLFTGHAHAPPGGPVRELPVRLVVRDGARGLVDKALLVRRAEPFESLPLTYEGAFGGMGWPDNPHGVGADGRGGEPSILHPTIPNHAVGFAPISRAWLARRRLLGATSRSALDAPVAEIPDGFDLTYFQAAPPDQRFAGLRGDEQIQLEGLVPGVPRLVLQLPGLAGRARITGLSGPEGLPLELRPDTLRVDGDDMAVTVLLRASFVVPDEAALPAVRMVAGVESPGAPIRWPAAPTRAAAKPPLPPGKPPPRAAKPPPPPAALAATLAAERTQTLSEANLIEDGGTLQVGDVDLDEIEEVFPDPSVPPAAGPRGPEGTVLLSAAVGTDPGARPVLPFPAVGRAPAVPAGPVPGAPWSAERATPTPVVVHEETVALGPPPVVAPLVVAVVAPPPAAPPPVAPPVPPPFVPPPFVPPPPGSSPVAAPAPPAPAPGDAARFFHVLPPVEPSAGVPEDRIPSRVQDGIPIATPPGFVAFALPWRMRPETATRTVVVKATFDLVPDGVPVRRAEADLPSGDVHEADELRRSLRYPSDFAVFKPRADVVLTGHAHAPSGSAERMVVSFRFGRGASGFERRIAVFGDRVWEEALVKLAPGAPRRFEKVALVHERAFGGPGFADNPVGLGYRQQRGPDGRAPLPNLEDPARLVERPGDAPAPACFAAVPMLWAPRWSKLGTYDARWKATRWPYFPEDFDWGFFQAAPPAQQLPWLTGDEPFEIAGVHPRHAVIRGRLPGARPRCFVQRTSDAGGGFVELPLRLDTVVFDADAMKLGLVWRGLLEVDGDEAADVAELFVFEDGDTPLSLAEAEAKARAARTPLAAVGVDPDAAPGNDRGAPEVPRDERVRGKLAAAGIDPDGPPPPAPPPPPPAPAGGDVRARIAGAGSLDGADLAGLDLAAVDLAGRSLARANLSGARLAGGKLAGADLTGANLAGADLSCADLTGARLDQADLTGARLPDALLDGASLAGADLSGAHAPGASFREARGARPLFVGAALAGARFERAELEAADFTRASLEAAVLDDAVLPAVRLYDVRGAGASLRGAKLDGARADGAELVRAKLDGVSAPDSVWDRSKLDDASLLRATLRAAGFAKASCPRALFSEADLRDARLGRARLAGASLLRANLMGASLEGADLTSADLRGANLHGAETWKAKLDGARLEGAIVTGTKLGGRS